MHSRVPLIEWSGRAPAPPASDAGMGRVSSGAPPCPTNQSRPLPPWASISARIRSTWSGSTSAARSSCGRKWSRGQIEARVAAMPPCLIGMEACVGAHHLSRKLQAHGHDGPGHNTLQSEAGYIDARPQSRQIDETSCDARPDHTNGSKCEEFKVKKASLQCPNDQTLLAGARNFAEDQFRTKALAETVALALRRLRFGPPTLAGYLFGPA